VSCESRADGSIPFTRSNVYKGFLTFAGFCISFASARRFPPPDRLQDRLARLRAAQFIPKGQPFKARGRTFIELEETE
jgi:hypothetical protein